MEVTEDAALGTPLRASRPQCTPLTTPFRVGPIDRTTNWEGSDRYGSESWAMAELQEKVAKL